MEKWKWEVGKTYTTSEMINLFGISQSTWDRAGNKDKYLDNFSLYYEYEVKYKGQGKFYHILKQLGDYQKPPSKRDKAIRDATYSAEIINVIEVDNIQTAANVSRIIKDNEPIRAFNHKEGTVYEYTRVRMREMFGRSLDEGGTVGGLISKIWCKLDRKLNMYIPIGDVMEEAFLAILKKDRQGDIDFEAEIYNDYDIGLISAEQRDKLIGKRGFETYLRARKHFADKYGFYPIKVPEYGIYGKDILLFEDEKSSVA